MPRDHCMTLGKPPHNDGGEGSRGRELKISWVLPMSRKPCVKPLQSHLKTRVGPR